MEIFVITIKPKLNACSIEELYKKLGDSLPLYKEFSKEYYVFYVDCNVNIEKIIDENNYEFYGNKNIIKIDKETYNKDYKIIIQYSGTYLIKK